MPNSSLSYPKVCKRYDGLYYIDFKLNSKRYRLFSGSKIGSSLSPNTYPLKLRKQKEEMAAKAEARQKKEYEKKQAIILNDKRKKKAKELASTGLASKINPEDYTKVLIEQNEAIIGLLGLQVINSSGMMGDAFSLIHMNNYYDNIKEYMNVDLDA